MILPQREVNALLQTSAPWTSNRERQASRWTRLAAVVCALLVLLGGSAPVSAAVDRFAELHGDKTKSLTPESIIERQLDQVPTEELETVVRALDQQTQDLLPPFDIKAMIFDGEGVKWGEMGRRLLYTLTAEIAFNLNLLGQLVVLGVFCAILRSIAVNIGGNEAGDLAFLLCLLVLFLISLQAFRASVELASTTLDQMVSFMHAILPVLATLLAAVGAITTAAVFHPLLYATVTTIAMLVRAVLFPLVLLTAALAVLGSISKEFPLKQMSGVLRTGSMVVLGVCFLAFFAVMQARGAIAPVADGFAIRTAKFLTGSFVPVVGGRLADALDVIIGGSVLIKNAVGVFGMGAIAAITAFPIIKIFSILAIFRIATALVEPITDPRLVQAMSSLATSLSLLLAGMITAALMFFVGITVVVGVGNAAAVMR